MSVYAMTWRGANGLRMQPVIAASLQQAWAAAFDLAQQLGDVRGFGLRRVHAGAPRA